MTSKNIFNILIIFIVVGFVVYSFYNCNQITTKSDNVMIHTKKINEYYQIPKEKFQVTQTSNINQNSKINQIDRINRINSYLSNENKNSVSEKTKSPKRVFFDSKVTYYNYDANSPPKSITKSKPVIKNYSASKTTEDKKIDKLIKENKQSPKINLSGNIIPSNFDVTNPNEKWDSSFGLPLMDKKEQAAFFTKMMDNYGKYTQTLDKFGQYVTDQSTVIKTDTTIDPFKSSMNSEKLHGKTVQEIYDEQVRGPRIVEKKIKARTSDGIVYHDESELNGGLMKGINLVGANDWGSNSYGFGLDRGQEHWDTAAFGNGF